MRKYGNVYFPHCRKTELSQWQFSEFRIPNNGGQKGCSIHRVAARGEGHSEGTRETLRRRWQVPGRGWGFTPITLEKQRSAPAWRWKSALAVSSVTLNKTISQGLTPGCPHLLCDLR